MSVITRPPLGEFEVAVLMAIAHLQGEGYGASILGEIEQRTKRNVSRGAIYITLDRLSQKRLVSSTLGESLPQRGGRPRRTFRLTASGQRALRHAVSMFVHMHAGLDAVLEKP